MDFGILAANGFQDCLSEEQSPLRVDMIIFTQHQWRTGCWCPRGNCFTVQKRIQQPRWTKVSSHSFFSWSWTGIWGQISLSCSAFQKLQAKNQQPDDSRSRDKWAKRANSLRINFNTSTTLEPCLNPFCPTGFFSTMKKCFISIDEMIFADEKLILDVDHIANKISCMIQLD